MLGRELVVPGLVWSAVVLALLHRLNPAAFYDCENYPTSHVFQVELSPLFVRVQACLPLVRRATLARHA